MTTGKGVVFAFFGRREGTDAVELTIGVEGIATTGQDLMAVGLMADVPDNAVVGRVEHVVHGHREFHGAQA